jgi:predicted nuclease of predicted toxin-antitoxin system
MPKSQFRSELKFLRDENVTKRLEIHLIQKGFDIISKPKGLSNGKLASFSKLEKRILVTNDWDFAESSKEQVFSVVWLRIPQDKPQALLDSFSKLLKQKPNPEDFEGLSVILKEERFEFKHLDSK